VVLVDETPREMSAAGHFSKRIGLKGYLRFCTRRGCVLMSSSYRGGIVSEAFQRMTKSSDPTSDMTRNLANKQIPSSLGIFSPLRYAVFRRIWTASLLSNLGLLILGVGAAWAMTKLSSSTGMVALVQTSLMLPVALVSTPAGAIADMFDRRIVGLVALSIALAGSISLSALAWLGVVTPVILLVSCFIIGSGMALFGPAWQASVSEQVPVEALPSAVALNGISYNIARSFGPAIGGVIVASAGAVAAFVTNALLYLPLLIVLFLWRRLKEPSRLPPERLARAVISGVRYVVHSPPIRIVLGRTLATGIAGGSVSALMPIVARDLLHGGAQTYGVILGAFGIGAVIGALNISTLRGRLGDEVSIRLCMIVMGACVAVVAVSRLSSSPEPAGRLRSRCSMSAFSSPPRVGSPVERWRPIRRPSQAGSLWGAGCGAA
jgi:MFS family permease